MIDGSSRLMLFDVAGSAGQRSMGVAGLFFLPVTLDALGVHDLFGLQAAGGLHLLDGRMRLGEDTVAHVAVAQAVLMPGMGKGDFPLVAAKELHVGGPPVGGRGTDRHGAHQKNHHGTDSRDKALHTNDPF
ncbi:hypothetical protein DESC_780163 [Desulfosarcina cetonica]|nr:hypothetical protein DESC_780163 [Desulfosarcina cetonica]